MCINLETSIATFIIGTGLNVYFMFNLINYIKTKNKIDKDALYCLTFIIWWQYALLMQIPDALAWIDIKNNNYSDNPGKLAFILNITQPIIVFISTFILIYLTNKKNYLYLIPGFIVIVFYIINVFNQLKKKNINYNISPDISKNCNSLNYQWWDHISPLIYVIVIPLIILSLMNLKWCSINIFIFFATLIISMLLKSNCNPGSFWCWAVASAGLINYLIFKNF